MVDEKNPFTFLVYKQLSRLFTLTRRSKTVTYANDIYLRFNEYMDFESIQFTKPDTIYKREHEIEIFISVIATKISLHNFKLKCIIQ